MKSIFLSLSLLSLSFGQKPGDNQVREGADAFYNYEYERSIEILDKAEQRIFNISQKTESNNIF